MAPKDVAPDVTAPQALTEWREFERLASVARRGREAAEVAARAAELAARAATDTAEAARAALEASIRADESAARTAQAARLAIEAASVDLSDTAAASEVADREAIAARDRYQQAVAKAAARVES